MNISYTKLTNPLFFRSILDISVQFLSCTEYDTKTSHLEFIKDNIISNLEKIN